MKKQSIYWLLLYISFMFPRDIYLPCPLSTASTSAASIMSLPENVFPLLTSSLPVEKDADSYGDLLFFSKKTGWIIAKHYELDEMISEYNCTHWTYTPDSPVDEYEMDSTRTELLRNTGWLKWQHNERESPKQQERERVANLSTAPIANDSQ